MSLTGKLGTPNSSPGNLLLGSPGGGLDLSATLQGTSTLAATAIGQAFSVSSSSFHITSSILTVSFNQAFTIDATLLDPASYTVTGPSTVTVESVFTANSNTLSLLLSGVIEGTYAITVVGSVVSIDLDPLQPGGNVSSFDALVAYADRSLFTNQGPLVKPNFRVQFGSKWSVQTTSMRFFGTVTTNEVVLPGATLNSSHVGLYLRLEASTGVIDPVNGGDYKILAVVNPSRVRVQASFRAPASDIYNDVLSNAWTIYDPETGFIADSPSDVVVRVNGFPVAVDRVIGLLGQIILSATPAPGSSISIDYSWIYNPTVEFRRLNSLEFVSNRWVRAPGVRGARVFPYRNAIQTTTGGHSRILVDDIRSPQPQPLLREVFYRAWERAYSALSNDKTLLRLNTPKNRIAYPPLSRQLAQVSVSYDAVTLPETDPTNPWELRGTGTDVITGNFLVATQTTAGPFPDGKPFYWTRGVDLTFTHAYATTWQLQITSTTPKGVFTGVAVGWSNSNRVVVLGYLLDGGVHKIGFLTRGNGNDPSMITAWSAFEFDWSTIHSYRLFRDTAGIVSFFVDGEVVPSISISEDQLPFLEELDDSFNEIQNVFFGCLSRETLSQSSWGFVRYLVIPTNPQQSVPSSFVSYTPTLLPEIASPPWTPVGYHGNEELVSSALILDSTSATTLATSDEVGLVGGDFKGFTRIEPLLSIASETTLDFELTLRTLTHGIAQNSVMAAVDDGNRLVQICFFPTKFQPKVSYPGRSFPEEATPLPWTVLGGATAVMVGRTLQIRDTSPTDGRVYAIEDLEPSGSDARIFDSGIDYYFEFKCEVLTSTPDVTSDHFCGATADVYDGLKTIGVMLRKDPSPEVAFHSDGVVLQSFSFNWDDLHPHVYRVAKNTSGNLVTLYIDGVLIGSYAYSSFTTVAPAIPTFSFGSSTTFSSQSLSVVNWYYANGWRAQPASGVNHYVGIWKGTDPTSLLGYYLPLKAMGSGKTIVSGLNGELTDLLADFVADGVQAGDDLVIDYGENRGVYTITIVTTNTLTVSGPFLQPGSIVVDYRVPDQFDWVSDHTYHLTRDPAGFVTLTVDLSTTPIIRVEYTSTALPASSVGLPFQFNRGLPSVTWGSFDPTNLSQTAWKSMQYGITRSPIEVQAVPPHQVSNQRNVMASPEHLFGTVAHNHTQYSCSSTGVPYPWESYVNNPDVHAFTQLNEGTPIVPATQTFEIRKQALTPPYSIPPGVLYNKLEMIEKTTGETGLLSAFSDDMVSMTFNPPVVSLSAYLLGGSGLDANAE